MAKKKPLTIRNTQLSTQPALLDDLRNVIEAAREQTARAVNSTLVIMYWQIGKRIREDVLQNERAEYGKEILQTLSAQLTEEYGRGFDRRNLHYMVRFAELFPDEQIVNALRSQLSWTHFRELLSIEEPIKREFYAEMCRVERWSTRTLQHKIGHLLFERTAVAKKPAKLIADDIATLRDEDRLTPDMVFRDPYFLDFLGLSGFHSEKDVEEAILRELEAFILELGTDFAFVARQKRIIPTEGSLFLGIDYSAIELRTLAAVLESRYGRSRLADVLRDGVDPHSFTASMFRGVSLEEFSRLPNRKQLRQQAKALNFGIPGGLGAKSLVAYAATTYGVELSIEEASLFRDRLIGEVYPELSEYLKDDPVGALAHNLKTSPVRVRTCFETDGALGAAKRIVEGKGRASGAEYGEAFIDRTWESLKILNENRRLTERIAKREAGEQLSRDLFFGPVVTLTGRLRGKVGFSQSRNTPFQGIAADGAKIALWGLYRAGFRVVAFIHDEVLIELPVESDLTAWALRVDRILCESMEQLTGSVPIACEYALSDRWYKAAEAVFDENGRLCLWNPKK